MNPLLILQKVTNRLSQRGIRIWNGHTLYRHACRHFAECVPASETLLQTDMKKRRNHAFRSRLADAMIEHLLDLGCYTKHRILVIEDPYCSAPLTALLVLNTIRKCRVCVTLDGEPDCQFQSEAGTRHRIPIVGLHAGRRNKLILTILDGDTVLDTKEFYLTAAPLPQMLTDMISVEEKKQKSSSPLIFVYGGDTRFPYAFDETGEIRYYLSRRPKAYGLFPLSDGRFLFLVRNVCSPSFANPHSVLAWEMDFLGRVHREYYLPDGLHHDGSEMMPGGNILTASGSLKEYVEDAIIEIDRQSGRVIKKLCLQEVLSDHPYFDYFDWAHINTVSYLSEEHAIIICARNLHSVLKIDWKDGKLLWILCDTSFWKDTPYESYVLSPKGKKMSFSYQPHAAYLLPNHAENGCRRLILFDNHWQARRPIKTFDGSRFSYVRIYEINETNHTVSLLHNYKTRKSKIRSNGICVDDRVFSMSGYLTHPIREHEGMITEYDRDSKNVLNRYLTYNSFYRAYPFFADYAALSRPMTQDGGTLLISSGYPVLCEPIPTADACDLPAYRTPEKTEETRKRVRKWERIKAYKHGERRRDPKTDLSGIVMEFYDQLFLTGAKDHLIEKIFFVGKKFCYVKDFTDTVQKSPALFENYSYYVSAPISCLKPDTYDVYLQCRQRLYRTQQSFCIVSDHTADHTTP